MNACTTLLCLCLLAPLSAGAQAPAPAKPSLAQTSQATQKVAEAYFQAYIARDWDRLEPLLAEAGRFEDPTASSVFGGVGKQGKTAVMQGFREGYASINQMSFPATTRCLWANWTGSCNCPRRSRSAPACRSWCGCGSATAK